VFERRVEHQSPPVVKKKKKETRPKRCSELVVLNYQKEMSKKGRVMALSQKHMCGLKGLEGKDRLRSAGNKKNETLQPERLRLRRESPGFVFYELGAVRLRDGYWSKRSKTNHH